MVAAGHLFLFAHAGKQNKNQFRPAKLFCLQTIASVFRRILGKNFSFILSFQSFVAQHFVALFRCRPLPSRRKSKEKKRAGTWSSVLIMCVCVLIIKLAELVAHWSAFATSSGRLTTTWKEKSTSKGNVREQKARRRRGNEEKVDSQSRSGNLECKRTAFQVIMKGGRRCEIETRWRSFSLGDFYLEYKVNDDCACAVDLRPSATLVWSTMISLFDHLGRLMLFVIFLEGPFSLVWPKKATNGHLAWLGFRVGHMTDHTTTTIITSSLWLLSFCAAALSCSSIWLRLVRLLFAFRRPSLSTSSYFPLSFSLSLSLVWRVGCGKTDISCFWPCSAF